MGPVDRLHDHDSVVVTLPRSLLAPILFRARILAIAGMTVTLEAENAAETVRVLESVPNAFLTFRHADALVGFRGTLHLTQQSGDFRFNVSDRAAIRSRSTRINCMTGIGVRRVSGEEPGEEVQGVTLNVASAGLLIEAAGTDAVTGDVVEFHMNHPDERGTVISGEADVVRHGEGLIAVAVTDKSFAARAALAKLVVARSRRALHKNDPVSPEAPGS
jgi:hypothetical protein